MATVGICVYCSAPAIKTCSLCGKAICARHRANETPGACVSCARGGVMATQG